MSGETGHVYVGKDLEAMSFAEKYHEWILSELRPYLGATIAEVGAGIGSVSRLILESPIDRLDAFEPSADMFGQLQQNLASDPRANAINGFFGVAPADTRYDSIVYINVLEHIENDAEELTRAREALHDGGHLLVFVPALPWLYSDLDREVGHFRRYLKRGLRSLIKEAGLEIVRLRYFDIAGVLPWYVNFVLLRNSISGGSVALYDRLVVPVMRIVETVLPLPLGKNLLLVARKGHEPARKSAAE
jgi:SAM-dependent methyltransferase